jgi:hypothetical protein
MVDEILSDFRVIDDRSDTHLREVCLGTNAGEEKNLRCTESTSREDNLFGGSGSVALGPGAASEFNPTEDRNLSNSARLNELGDLSVIKEIDVSARLDCW